MTASPQGKAIVRPVLTSNAARTTAKRRLPQALNHVDHVRGDADPSVRLSLRAVTPMGRFHSQVPRQFSSSAALDVANSASTLRRADSKSSLRVGYASEARIAKLLKPSTAAPQADQERSGAVDASPRRSSASFTTSVDNPLSPRHALRLPIDDQLGGLSKRTSSASSLSGIQRVASGSRLWNTGASDAASDVAPRGIRTYNSALRLLPNRVLIPDANGVVVAGPSAPSPRQSARSNSPTFRTSTQLADANPTKALTEVGDGRGLRTAIPTFEHPVREARSFTPTRRFCSAAQRESSVFKPAEEITSESRPLAQRRANTPPPPPRSRCELSLIDGPSIAPSLGRRRAPAADVPSASASSAGGDGAVRGRRHFSPSVDAIGSSAQGYLGRAMSVQRVAHRNASSLVFDWQ